MKLIFIYNADTGWLKALAGGIHKLVAPRTYPCDLCRLTHGLSGMKKEIAQFIKTCGMEVVVIHRDEIPTDLFSALGAAVSPPAVIVRSGERCRVLLGAEALSQIQHSTDFLSRLSAAIKQHD